MDESSLVKTTVFDLIWKLKRELERQGHEKIDLHRFTHDQAYRHAILLNIDITELPMSKPLQQIYTELLAADTLELTQEVELPPEPITTVNNTANTSIEAVHHNNKPVYMVFAIVVFLLFGFSLIQFTNTTEKNTVSRVNKSLEKQPLSPSAPLRTNTSTVNLTSEPLADVSIQTTRSIIQGYQKSTPSTVAHNTASPTTLVSIQGSNTIGELHQ